MDLVASAYFLAFYYYSCFFFYFYFYFYFSAYYYSFMFDFDFDRDFFSFYGYYSDCYYFLLPFTSNLNPSASVGFTLEAGSNHISVLCLISTYTPLPTLLSLIYVPLVLRSVNTILSSFFSIWQCLELNLLSLMGTSHVGTLPITTTILSRSYAARPEESGTIFPQLELTARSIVFYLLIYWDINILNIYIQEYSCTFLSINRTYFQSEFILITLPFP